MPTPGTYGDIGATYGSLYGPGGTYGEFAGVPSSVIRNWCARAYVPGSGGTPPSVPTGLAVVVTAPTVGITFDASTDDVAVLNYDIYRNGAYLATTALLAFTDTPPGGQLYAYQVLARDTSGLVSDLCASVTADVPDLTDTIPPSAPTVTSATLQAGTYNVNVAWSGATDTPPGKVVNNVIYRRLVGDTTWVAINFDPASPFVDTVPAPADYEYAVRSLDAATNISSTYSPAATVHVPFVAPPPDTTPPSVPTGLAVRWTGSTIVASWNASSDPSGIGGYIVEQDGNPVWYGTAQTATITGVKSGTTYAIRVAAFDASPNRNLSAYCTAVNVTAPSGFTPNLSDSSGKNDVGGELQAFLDSLPLGSMGAHTVVNMPRSAVYRSEQTIQFHKPFLTIHGNDTIIVEKTHGPVSGSWYIDSLAYIWIDHLHTQGSQPEPGSPTAVALAAQLGVSPYDGYNGLYRGGIYEGMYGWRIFGDTVGCDNIILDTCNVSNVWSDFWNFEGHHRNTNCTVKNSVGHVSGRQGLVVGDVENFEFVGGAIDRAARTTIDSEPGSSPLAGVAGLTLHNFTVDGGKFSLFSFIVGEVGHDIHLENIPCTHRPATGGIGHAGGTAFYNVFIRNVNGTDDINGDNPLNNNRGPGKGDIWNFKNTLNITVQSNRQSVSNSHAMYYVGADADCTITDVSGNSGTNLDGQLDGPS